MSKKTKSSNIGFRVSLSIKELAQKAASQEGRSLSNWIINLIKQKTASLQGDVESGNK